MATNPFNDLTTIATQNSGYTANGTKIRTASTGMDQDAFVKILSAELANQDPENSQDPTQFVAQMAQFSSVEQMLNLNRTMTFNSASSLIGKTVNLDEVDENGVAYKGVVKNVIKNGDSVKLDVQLVDSNGNFIRQEKLDSDGNVVKDSNGNVEYETTKQEKLDSSGNPIKDSSGNIEYDDVPVYKEMNFDYTDVSSISTSNGSAASQSGSDKVSNLNSASSLIDKLVNLDTLDSNGKPYRGVVRKVVQDGDAIKLYVQLIDSDGNFIKQEKLDSSGNVVKDSNGNVEYETTKQAEVDSSGNVVKDSNGNIVYQDVPVYKVKTFDYTDLSGISDLDDVTATE